MIVSIRGTNGAGKSTLVRRLMSSYDEIEPCFEEGRRRPLGYFCHKDDRHLFVLGHYEIANGGMDTIKDADRAYELIREMSDTHDVVYEGKNMSDGVQRLIGMRHLASVVFAFIAIDVEECIASVRRRGHRIREKTIRSIHAKMEKQMVEVAGYDDVELIVGDRDHVATEVERRLGL